MLQLSIAPMAHDYSLSGAGEILAPRFFISDMKLGYETSTDSAPATIDFSVSIAAIVNAMIREEASFVDQ